MTYLRKTTKNLNNEEWNKLIELKNAIKYNLAAVLPSEQEEFTAYLVQSMRERGG